MANTRQQTTRPTLYGHSLLAGMASVPAVAARLGVVEVFRPIAQRVRQQCPAKPAVAYGRWTSWVFGSCAAGPGNDMDCLG